MGRLGAVQELGSKDLPIGRAFGHCLTPALCWRGVFVSTQPRSTLFPMILRHALAGVRSLSGIFDFAEPPVTGGVGIGQISLLAMIAPTMTAVARRRWRMWLW